MMPLFFGRDALFEWLLKAIVQVECYSHPIFKKPTLIDLLPRRKYWCISNSVALNYMVTRFFTGQLCQTESIN